MKKELMAGLATGLLSLALVGTANAAPMTGYSDFDSGYTLLDFDELTHLTTVDNQYSAYGVTISGTTGLDGTGDPLDVKAYAWWDPTYLGLDQHSWGGDEFVGSIIFTFDASTMVTQFGLNFITAYASDDPYLTLFDGSGISIEQVTGDQTILNEQFLGIDTGGTRIAYAIASTPYLAIDDVAFNNSAPVPEPVTMLLFGTGLMGLVGHGLRRKKK